MAQPFVTLLQNAFQLPICIAALPTIALLLMLKSAAGEETNTRMDTTAIEQRGIRELQQLLPTHERLIKAHAAESLLKLNRPEGIYEAFVKEWDAHQNVPPYRVVVMRVLSRASKTPAERDAWSKRIRDVFADTKQPDRLHAIECLAKLGYQVELADQKLFKKAAAGKDPQIAIFAHWTLGSKDFQPHERAVVEYLKSADPSARYTAAYVLRQVPKLSNDAKAAIRTAGRAEKPGTLAFAYLNGASLVASTPADREEAARCRGVLAKLADTADHDEAREIAAVLGECGTSDDHVILDKLLISRDPDVREAVAHARVAIARRSRDNRGHSVTLLLVIGDAARPLPIVPQEEHFLIRCLLLLTIYHGVGTRRAERAASELVSRIPLDRPPRTLRQS